MSLPGFRNFLFFISFPLFLFQFLFCYILKRKDKKSFKRDSIVLISFLIIFVSISFLVNIGKIMSLPGFRSTASMILTLNNVLNTGTYTDVSNAQKYGIYAPYFTALRT